MGAVGKPHVPVPASPRRLPFGLPAAVVALGLVSLFTDMSSEMIYPLLPAFLLGALGAGPAALGLIEGIAESTAAVLKIVSGAMADRMTRRTPLVIGGYSLSGLVRPLIGLAGSWPAVLACRFADRVGKGLRTAPRDALIADAVPAERRGRAFGLHRAMDHAGATIGPAIAALLLGAGLSYRAVFLAAFAPALAVVAILLLAVRDTGRAAAEGTAAPAASSTPPTRPGVLLGAVLLNALGTPSDAFLLLRLTTAGIAPALVAWLWAAHSALRAGATLAAGWTADRTRRVPLVVAGWCARAVFFVGFGLAERPEWLVAAFLAYGLAAPFTEPAERALVADVVKRGARGRGYGFYHGAVGLGALPASALFGWLWQAHGPAAALWSAAGVTGVAVAIVLAHGAAQAGRAAADKP